MSKVTGTLNGNLLKLSGNSDEINEFNHKLSLFAQFLDTVGTKSPSELIKLMSAQVLQPSKTVDIGIAGEKFVEEYIDSHLRLNEEWHVTNVSKDGKMSSDLELAYKNLHCVIEVKNIQTKLSECNVKKFREEYILNESKQYNSGIFVSLNSDYYPGTGVGDFHIQEISGRFVIYLARVKENPEKIIFAMEVLNQLVNITYDRDNKRLLDMLNKQVKHYGVLSSNANKIAAAAKEIKQNIDQFKKDLIEFIQSCSKESE